MVPVTATPMKMARGKVASDPGVLRHVDRVLEADEGEEPERRRPQHPGHQGESAPARLELGEPRRFSVAGQHSRARRW